MRPNRSPEATRYGRRRRFAPGHVGHRPSPASRHPPPGPAPPERWTSTTHVLRRLPDRK